MIVGVGIDLCQVSRIRAALSRHEGRFATRVFTDGERAYCDERADPAQHYAARFAAKEALLKALTNPSEESRRIKVAIIEGLDHPHYLAPSGGSLIDLTTLDGPDTMPHLFQATGLLPGDAVFYEDAQVLEGEGFAALQLRGMLPR